MGGAFEKAVKSVSVISDSYCLGLTAMGSYSAKVKATNTRLLEGSVDIDAATKKTYPESNRWDYALGYDGLVYYVEVHPASTSEVNTVIAKKVAEGLASQ